MTVPVHAGMTYCMTRGSLPEGGGRAAARGGLFVCILF